MQLKLHANATTTPKTRTYIQAALHLLQSSHSNSDRQPFAAGVIANLLDLSHTPHKLFLEMLVWVGLIFA